MQIFEQNFYLADFNNFRWLSLSCLLIVVFWRRSCLSWLKRRSKVVTTRSCCCDELSQSLRRCSPIGSQFYCTVSWRYSISSALMYLVFVWRHAFNTDSLIRLSSYCRAMSFRHTCAAFPSAVCWGAGKIRWIFLNSAIKPWSPFGKR